MNRALILGSGGREHALAWKLHSEGIETHAYPGNPGIFTVAKQTGIEENTFCAIAQYAKSNSIDLVIIGPEQYLAEGLADFLNERGIRVFGPSRSAARIETDKSYAKNLMRSMHVNTADYHTVSSSEAFMEKANRRAFPYVIKVAGLAAGKGAYVINNADELNSAYRDIFEKRRFGNAADRIVIEDFLEGEELSLFVITDGQRAVPMLPAQDYKRAYDGDKGPNTGGMGSFAPYRKISAGDIDRVMEEIIFPVLKGMRDDGFPFRGLLYAGLMKDGSNISVVEFNARFGDPETQSVLYLMKSSLFDIMVHAAEGDLGSQTCSFSNEHAVTVILAAEGYPVKYEKGMEISIGNMDSSTYVFHAGTREENSRLLANGGRIMGITSRDESLENAIKRVYTNIQSVNIDKSFFRKDIAHRGLSV